MFDESNDRFYSKLFAGGTEGQYFYNQDNPDFSSIGGSQLSGGFSPYSGIGGAGSGSFGVGGGINGRTSSNVSSFTVKLYFNDLPYPILTTCD